MTKHGRYIASLEFEKFRTRRAVSSMNDGVKITFTTADCLRAAVLRRPRMALLSKKLSSITHS
ncbi:hypothetical protein QE412_003342 [Microbacterium trichothecenolyticum]|uniref:Uncharacterized protein n=1 Tax=Microbacterium trichothecenolyticum TaxID=69370 RepID=A0ABU0TYP4_MICTR|nr:hypothetical protein [Microbacterium trichothecenolyticum]